MTISGAKSKESTQNSPRTMPSEIFASYSREDHAQVFLIVDKFRERGLNIWIDQEGNHGAKLWSQE